MITLETLTKTQVPVLISYSMPFVLLSALIINNSLLASGLSGTPTRLLLLSASFPIGFSIGRAIYIRWSHTQITFDSTTFSVTKGSKEILNDSWRNYKTVSIIMDRYGRPNLRLYKPSDEEFSDLPISKTNAKPLEFRDFVQNLLSPRKAQRASLQVAEVA